MSQLGFSDLTLEAGKIFGSVPYTLLFIPSANQTYMYEKTANNLMNFMEFVSDEYVSVIYDHYLNGLFLNKIPVIKHLKWREIASFRILYGGLTSANNPRGGSGVFEFSTDASGTPIVFGLGNLPYIEGSLGIGNIGKFLRVDLVKRFTYLDNPNIAPIGLRANIQLDF